MKCLSIFFIFLIIAEMCGSLNRDDYTREEFVGTEWQGPDGATLRFISRDSVTFRNVNWDSITSGWEAAKKFPSSGTYTWTLATLFRDEPEIDIFFPGTSISFSLRQRRWKTQIYTYIGDPDLLDLYVFKQVESNK